MKKTIALLTAAVAGVSSLNAQNELSVSTTLGLESAYVFRGVQYADAHMTASIDASYAGAYVGIWSSIPVEGTGNPAIGNEYDLYFGYSFAVSELISLDVGATYYTYEGNDWFSNDGNTFEAYVGASFDLPLSPAIYVYRDFDLKNYTFEASAGYVIEVSETTDVEINGYLGYEAWEGFGDWMYFGASAGVNYAFTETASVGVTLNYGATDRDYWFDGKFKDNKLWVGASFTAGF